MRDERKRAAIAEAAKVETDEAEGTENEQYDETQADYGRDELIPASPREVDQPES